MPRYDHFLTKDEQAQTWNAHIKLQGADAEWLQQKCQAMTDSTGYRLTGRASVDNALRLFLIRCISNTYGKVRRQENK